jgi:thioredoxin 1
MFKPVVQEVSNTVGVPVTYVDAQRQQDLAQKYSITSVPTIIVEKQGNVVFRNTGVMPKQQLAQVFDQFR